MKHRGLIKEIIKTMTITEKYAIIADAHKRALQRIEARRQRAMIRKHIAGFPGFTAIAKVA